MDLPSLRRPNSSSHPLRFANASNQTFPFGGGSRPNWVAGQEVKIDGSAHSGLGRWFNTGAFAAPPAATFGNLPRTITAERAHGINNWDFALFKTTRLTERVGLQFRTEFFNLFNRVQFAPRMGWPVRTPRRLSTGT